VTRLCLGVAFSLSLASSTLAAQDSVEARVLAAEDLRFAAMIRADTAALRTLLADDLAYTHTTGQSRTRPHFCARWAAESYATQALSPPSAR